MQPDESEVSQTETNLETKDRNDSELSGNSGINAQTDLEPESDKENSSEDAEEAAVSEASGQTDTETEKKPGTRGRRRAYIYPVRHKSRQLQPYLGAKLY